MSKSTNTKVNRLLGALAVELRGLDDNVIVRIHNIINDDLDGYDFDFIGAVNSFRSFIAPQMLSVKERREIKTIQFPDKLYNE